MHCHSFSFVRRLVFWSVGILSALLWSGVFNATGFARHAPEIIPDRSPIPQAVSGLEAARLAHAYVATHPGAEIAMGTGDSMFPLYREGTMIVVQPLPFSQVRRGMTVVFRSAEGWPVAHLVVEQTSDGVVTQGLHNRYADRRPVTAQNYVGVVVQAYQLDMDPMMALARALSRQNALAMNQSTVASNP